MAQVCLRRRGVAGSLGVWGIFYEGRAVHKIQRSHLSDWEDHPAPALTLLQQSSYDRISLHEQKSKQHGVSLPCGPEAVISETGRMWIFGGNSGAGGGLRKISWVPLLQNFPVLPLKGYIEIMGYIGVILG